jgi:hypoxanthine phosphoribosyltransferase
VSKAADGLRAQGHPIGATYLTRAEIGARVAELGAELNRRLDGEEPILVAPLKSSVVFLADLSRAIACHHAIDTIELSPYPGGGGGSGVRIVKDVDLPLTRRQVVIVEDVVDTGLTLAFLIRAIEARRPAGITAVTLLDRPYRRLVDDLPLALVGFTVPDELFAGYGLGLDERWRQLPDLHLVLSDELPQAIAAA